MISFNIPPCVGDELTYVKQAMDSHKICGDGQFTKKCNSWMEERFHAKKVLLTTSGSTALDMAALLGVFLSAISQVMLKKAALRQYQNKLCEYLNPLVIIAYTIFVGTTFLSIYAYKGIPLSMALCWRLPATFM